MSERGSFCTEYIYCKKCRVSVYEALKAFNCGKYFQAHQIPAWNGDGVLPIVAGNIGGLYAGEEIHTFEDEVVPKIQKAICHPVRIVVLAENGEKIFTITPEQQ